MKNTKAIALYLPQFHEIPENNQWWGKGFTEWNGTKCARPLYPSHYQPHIPLHDNYYNLLDKKTMKWQVHLADRAGIHGFCFYHYWFSGRKILEKPAENLLKWKDINIHFCFSWANESWKRKWSKLKGNTWNALQQTGSPQEGDYLLEQKYGEEAEWKEHFEYLLPFFQDKRYIRVGERPVFIIYKPGEISRLNEMLECWTRLAVQNGLPGLYVIATNHKSRSKYVDADFQYEPSYTLNHEPVSDPPLSYSKICSSIIHREQKAGEKPCFAGVYTGFDTTPRYGDRATIIHGSTPERFYRCFRKRYQRSCKADHEFIFITAWNEWGEGAHLEPDQKFGYGYLAAVKKVLSRNSKPLSGKGI